MDFAEQQVRNRMSDFGRGVERYICERTGYGVGNAVERLVELMREGDTSALRWYLGVVFGAEPVRRRVAPTVKQTGEFKSGRLRDVTAFEGRPEYELRDGAEIA